MLLKIFNKRKINNIKKFNRIIREAKRIIEKNNEIEKSNSETCKNHPIYNYIRLVGRGIQTEYIQSLVIEGKEPTHRPIDELFFNFGSEINTSKHVFKAHDLIERSEIDKDNYKGKMKLGRDLIIPWPWDGRRLTAALCKYGSELHSKKWKEIESNHRIELWLPIGLGIVNSGNHSITSGILQADGEVKPNNLVIMNKLYDYIYTDGVYFKTFDTDKIISKVGSVEFAAIYEIGRLIIENKINFKL